MAAMLDELTIEDSEESFVIVPHPHIKTSCTCEKHVQLVLMCGWGTTYRKHGALI